MSAGLIASFIVPALLGGALSHGVWVRCRKPAAGADRRAELLLVAALALPLGLGLCSCLYFGWLVVWGPPGAGFAIAESALALGLGGMLAMKRSRARWRVSGEGGSRPHRTDGIARVAVWVLGITTVCALTGFAVTVLISPHGHWDAWMTWNLGARFLFKGGEHWTWAFADSLRHPDYPLLLQGAVARSWYYAGSDTVAAPIAIAFVFTAGTVVLTWAAVAVLRSRREAHLAALMLVGTTFLVLHGASQYADVPLGFFFLAAVVLFWLHDQRSVSSGFLLLAGLAAALGGWTKNEGLLFLVALAFARYGAVWPIGGARRYAREMKWFVLGAAPVLLVILYFKLQLAPANYLFTPGDHGFDATLGRLLDVTRYRFLAGAIKGQLLAFGETGMAGPIWLLAAYVVCAGIARGPKAEPVVRMVILTGCLMAFGHLLVLVVAPGDMPRLANASLNRLILQLWPVAVLTCFMTTTGLDERERHAPVRESQWT